MFKTLIGTPTKDTFARALMDTARKLTGFPQVAYDKERFRLVLVESFPSEEQLVELGRA